MTPPKRTYDFRIIAWQVFTPEEQERLYMQLLTSESLEVSDGVRKLVLEKASYSENEISEPVPGASWLKNPKLATSGSLSRVACGP